MNKVLIVTYYWPPSGGAGVQRWLKFSKYLPEFGWEPVILTVDPEYAAYPVTDNSLAAELPLSVKVHRTPAIDYFSIYKKDKSRIPAAGFANSVDNTLKGKILRFIRGNFFIPDPRRGWNKYAFRKACEIIEPEGINHVITTSPPHSTQLIGLKVKKKYPGIKWIADLRDPWTDIYYYEQFYPTFISKRIDSGLEKSVLKKADRIITVGASLKTLFSLKVKGVENKTDVITNGYDEDDFAGLTPSSSDIFTISYTGTLSDAYPIEGFLDALQSFKENGNDFRLRFIGTVSPKHKDLILSKTGNSIVEFIPYVDHATAIRYLLDTTVLLLIIPDHQSNKCIITGKLFEYIATGKPILCLGPVDGDAAEIIRTTGNGATFGYDDISGILQYISDNHAGTENTESSIINQFSRKELTSKLVDSIRGDH
ncbi:MAG: glycosyltransferase family 4 protein [Bacteroidales bacterium]|nr:glycosyltransferase family 4 protein [Bacteroidales bacterium]